MLAGFLIYGGYLKVNSVLIKGILKSILKM